MNTFEDIVVLLPGITGSILEKPDGERWSLSGSALAKAIRSLGTSVFDLELVDDDPLLDHAGDGVRATGLLNDLHILPGLWRVDGYSQLEKRLRRRLKLVEGENLRIFPYDWRRDNRSAARRLAAESRVWLEQQRSKGAADPKLIFVCHSMGGLVARYFLEVLEGWKDTRRLVTFGTPYRGSLKAVEGLSNGVHKAFVDLTPVTQMLRSFPSVHQLLPVYPCIDAGDGHGLVRVHELVAGLPGVRPDLAEDARLFHHEIVQAQATNSALDRYHDAGYSIHPVVGIEQQTLQSAQLQGASFDMLTTHDGQDLKGDGTVPFVSAFPTEWTDAADAMFLGTKHASMHNRPDGLAQVEGIIRGSNVDLSKFRSVDNWIALDNDDLYPSGDIEITVRTTDATIPTMTLEPHVSTPTLAQDTGGVLSPITGQILSSVSTSDAEQAHRVVFPAAPTGAWRIRGETPTARGSDSLLVIDPTT